MKKIFFGLLILFFSFVVSGQDITGIGDYKIGMNINEFLEISFIKDKEIKKQSEASIVPNENELWRITQDSYVDEDDRVYSSELIKYILKIPVGIPKIIINEDTYWTEIFFYKNSLVKIKILTAESSFREVLTMKYGKPVFLDKTYKITCQNSFGTKSIHNQGRISYKWGKEKKISAEYYVDFKGCGVRDHYYVVENSNVMQMIAEIETKAKKEYELNQKLNKVKATKL